MHGRGAMTGALAGKRILLGVSGSIAAYKAADAASQLGHLGADVRVILTDHAAQFVGAATFRALTKNPVLCDLFDEPFDRQIAHIQLAQESDLIVLAPASANLLAKMAHGIADDLLTATLLAATAPILAAPAMNSAMLEHPATQANLQLLRERGVAFVDPAFGILACRTEGWGKLAPVDDIVQAAVRLLTARGDFAGRRVLVTAGATREPLDPVRFLSNRSSGRMGVAVAVAAAGRGATVTLVAGFMSVQPPAGIEVVRVGTTEEMLTAVRERFADCDLVVAAAAPADYAPVAVSDQKIKKCSDGGGLSLELRETPDILREVTADKRAQVVVGFAAETQELAANAARKIATKRLDFIVANDVTAPNAGFDVETNVAMIIWPDGRSEELPQMRKREMASRILDAALPLLPVVTAAPASG